jgi:MoaD family protein
MIIMPTSHIKILFHATFREIAGKKEVTEEINPNHTLAEVLSKLAKQYGRDFNKIIDRKTRQINTDTLVMINGESIRKIDIKLKDNDVIMITVPVGGG